MYQKTSASGNTEFKEKKLTIIFTRKFEIILPQPKNLSIHLSHITSKIFRFKQKIISGKIMEYMPDKNKSPQDNL